MRLGEDTTTFRVQAQNLSCRVARSYVQRYVNKGGAHPRGYRCAETASYFRCIKGIRWYRATVVEQPTPPPAPQPPPPAAQGTRTNPWPLGTTAGDSVWQIRVNSVDFDAWNDGVLTAANPFNDPPPAGWQNVLVNLTIGYTGTATVSFTFGFDIYLGTVGAGGVPYRSYNLQHDCGVAPTPNTLDYDYLLTGATININECWQVPQTEVATLQLWYDRWSNGFFALR